MQFENKLSFAQKLDEQDRLKSCRDRFFIPEKNGQQLIYFCGNSLGLQPRDTEQHVLQELEDWRRLGVEGHTEAHNPWLYYHHFFEGESQLVGALTNEVVLMNTLTVNLHLLLVSFYRPKGKRIKVIMEEGAFPSDQYALSSHLRSRGIDPNEAIIEVKPRDGEYNLRTEDIVDTMEHCGDELALVFFAGVNYYTGQWMDMKRITEAAHQVGAMAGFDLAHATGNVPMQLHDWQVDFAAWCTYKYLNSGPGGVSGIFVHEKHGEDTSLQRFEGWWGTDENIRFEMKPEFEAQKGAAGWQLSNAPVLSMSAHKASLDIFLEAGMDVLREKSLRLTGYLEYLINEIAVQTGTTLKIITPEDPAQRGCQLSILTGPNGKQIFDYVQENGVVADWRNPDVIRLAPTPLYNTFEEVYRFGKILEDACKQG